MTRRISLLFSTVLAVLALAAAGNAAPVRYVLETPGVV
jgi:hypothetical protein